jgi:hypothetical protein
MAFQQRHEHKVGGRSIRVGHLETMRLARALAKDDDGGVCTVCRFSSIMND